MMPSQTIEQAPAADLYHSIALTSEELYALEEVLSQTLSETQVLVNYFNQISISEESANSQGYDLSEAAALLRGARQKEEHIKNIRHEITQLLSDLNDQ